ncbi:IPT/TIG domain-containing protein [Paenibacillus lautus]|uniref:IPT/TIG domain-containing protein n=1 Tax=Paenibacillus lautus TaxID=1401 RepID=UPI003D2A3A01
MKKQASKLTSLLLVLFILMGVYPLGAQAADNYVSVTKSVSPTTITTEEEALVTLNIKGTPPVNVIRPNDVILVIDRSGSMSDENKMQSAINSAKGFIDLMDLSKHSVGIVDYSSANNISSYPLSTDKEAVKNYVNGLRANGGTATGDAIKKARELLANHRPDAQPVIVLLTDGDATEPKGNAYNYALLNSNEAKQEGIVFYTIALLNANANPDTSGPNLLLKEMATTSHHHHFVLGSVGLADIYAAIVQEIGLASAYDVVVKDIVSPQFEIVPGSYDSNIPKPTVSGNTLRWEFLELKTDTLTFTYKIRHKVDQPVGTFRVSTPDSSIVYKDYTGAERKINVPSENVTVTYPKPTLNKIEPESGHVNGGESVVITGTNFRPNPDVKFGAASALNIQYISPTEIRVEAPVGNQGTVDLTVMNDDRQQVKAKYLYYADPIVTAITPSSGTMGGGEKVTISGRYFLNGLKVKIGENEAKSVVYKSSTSLTVTVPKSSLAGPVDVNIENPDGRSVTVQNGYTYIAPLKPTIESLSPNQGQLEGGESVVLKGTNIEAGAKLYFNDSLVNLSIVDNTEARFRAPAWPVAEKINVRLVNLSGEEALLPEGYTYLKPPAPPAPTIEKVTPNSGQLKGNELVTLTGTNIKTGAKLYFNDVEVGATVVSETEMRFRTPAWTVVEAVDIKVINPDLQEASLVKGYNYLLPPGPILTTLTPNEGLIEGGLNVSIKGSNFVNGARVYFNTKELSTTFVSDTELKIKTPAWSTDETVNVRVLNPDGQEALLSNGFAYIKPALPEGPAITAITPNQGEIKGNDLITVAGTNFVTGSKIFLKDLEVATSYISSTELRFRTPAWPAAEIVDVKVVSPNKQEAVVVQGFTFTEPAKAPAPTLTSVSPSTALTTGGELISVTGSNFVNGAKIYLDDTVISASFVSNTALRFRTPVWNLAESVDVKVVNPDGGEAILVDGFTFEKPVINPPKITSVDPNTSLLTGGTLVYINGSDYKAGVKLYLNSTEVPVSLLSDKMLRFRAPVWSVAETVDVKVINPDLQEAVATQAFTFTEPPKPAAPTIASISPNAGPLDGNNYVYIKGEHYQAGVKVTFGSVEAKNVTLLDAAQIRVLAPAVSSIGSVDVKVTNPDGQFAIVTSGYTYQEAPITISSISPNKGPLAGGQLVYIYGSNFKTGMTMQMDGKSQTFELLGAGSIRFRTPAGVTAGDVPIVLTSTGGLTASTTYTYEAPPQLPAPTITSISPDHGPLSGGALVYVYGSNFRAGITATWGGTNLAISYLSTGSIRFRVPAGTVPGPVELKLINTDQQSVSINYIYE